MSRPGRNDPCPCGSGRKHKVCCLDRDVVRLPFTPSDRTSALAALFRFAQRGELDETFTQATTQFWADWMRHHDDDELREAMGREESMTASLEWFAWDFRVEDGRTICAALLDRDRDRLRSGEIRYLERMRHAHLRLYEVAAVRPEEGLDLVDLWTGDRLPVRERLATRQLVQWDLIAARVRLDADNVPVLDGFVYSYPALARAPLLAALRKAHRVFRRRGGRDLVEFFKAYGMRFHHLWLDHVAMPARPQLVTADGDDFVLARLTFDVVDPGAVDSALAAHPDLRRQDDGSYVWLADPAGPRGRPPRRRRGMQIISTRLTEGEPARATLGVFVPSRRRLIFETTSKPRAGQGRAFIEALAGGALVYRATSYEDPAQVAQRAGARPSAPGTLPADVEARLIGEVYEQHYRTWPDTPLPALGGRTPRQAATVPSARSRLIALLKAMENGAVRQHRDGRPAYDFGWMWDELELTRPG